jgi:hypothetical protein
MSNVEINGNLRLATAGGIRGLFTTVDIAAEDIVVSLPVEQIISYHSIHNSPLKVLFEVEGLPNDVSLALFLIFEFYNDHSQWRAYLDMLPMEFDTALYFNDFELTKITGSPIGDEIRNLQENAHHVFEMVVPILIQSYPSLFHPKIFTMENFLWAQSVIDSRGIRLNLNGSASLCLLPLIDAINGNTISFLEGSTSLSLESEKKDAYTIRSLTPLNSGDQIFMNYGAFSSRELLLYYGYIDVNGVNEYDTYSFDLDVDDGVIGEMQTQLLSRLSLELDQHISFDGTVHTSTLMTMQILLSSYEELLQLFEAKDDHELGSLVYILAKHSKETKSNLRTILINLQEHIHIPQASSSSTSIRLENVYHYLQTQTQILQKAIDKLHGEEIGP